MKQYNIEIINIEEKLEDLLGAFNNISTVIGSTMGPSGRTVSINEPSRAYSTKDGANILRLMLFDNDLMDFAAKILRDITSRTVSSVGDGTTLTTILTSKLLEIVSNDDVDIYRTLDEAKELITCVIDQINTLKTNIDLDTKEGARLLKCISTISANNNEEFGLLVSGIITEVGKDGYISVQRSFKKESYTEKKRGYVVGAGMLHSAFMRGQAKVELKNPYALIIDQELDDYDKDLQFLIKGLNIRNQATGKNTPLVVFVKDLKGVAFQTLSNNLESIPIYPVLLPRSLNSRGDRFELIKDIQAAIGAKVLYSTSEGINIQQWENNSEPENDFGEVNRIIITPTECTIEYDGIKEIEESVADRLREIDDRLVDYPEDELLKSRRSILKSGIGVVYVDVNSENEERYIFDLLDDSVRASFSALRNGVVPGGGQTFLKILSDKKKMLADSLIVDMLTLPFIQILLNAGFSHDGISIIYKKIKAKEYNEVYDVKNKRFSLMGVNLVWDPADVLIHSLRNAISAVMISTSKYMINFNMNENYKNDEVKQHR